MKSEEIDMKGSSSETKMAPLTEGQRWTAARKREVVLRLLRGESKEVISREIGVEIYRLEEWHQKALKGIDASLTRRRTDPKQVELDDAFKRVGELTMENELLYRKIDTLENKRPLPRGRSRR